MKYLCVRESYEKAGETKVNWNRIGVLFESNGKQYVKLYHMPGVLISIFEPKPKDAPATTESDIGEGIF